MSSSDGKYYYIIQGLARPYALLKQFRLVESKNIFLAKVAVKVFIPNTVKLYKHRDKELQIDYYTVRVCDTIETFNPIVLTYVYGQWKRILFWEDLAYQPICVLMHNLGYVLNVELGWLSEKNIEHYNKTNKMLFG